VTENCFSFVLPKQNEIMYYVAFQVNECSGSIPIVATKIVIIKGFKLKTRARKVLFFSFTITF
jgi:hypothetical protein